MADFLVIDPLLGERNIVFGWPNRIDEATLSSSGTWQATLPLANLQNRVLATVACGLLTVLFVHVVRRLAAAVRGAGAQPQVSPFL